MSSTQWLIIYIVYVCMYVYYYIIIYYNETIQ